jgi:hypothetical protein
MAKKQKKSTLHRGEKKSSNVPFNKESIKKFKLVKAPLTYNTPSKTRASGKKRQIIVQTQGQMPNVFLGAVPQKNKQDRKSAAYKNANSVPGNSTAGYVQHAMGKTTPYINSPNSRYISGKDITKNIRRQDVLSMFVTKDGKTNQRNAFHNRAFEVGKPSAI